MDTRRVYAGPSGPGQEGQQRASPAPASRRQARLARHHFAFII